MADCHHPSNLDRVPRRTRVLMTATLLTPDGAQKVRVRDLSSRGARVLIEQPISDGSDALFKRGQVFAAASIVWSSRVEAGISFYRQLSSIELESAFNGAESIESAGDRRGRYPKKGVAMIGDAAPAS